VNLLVNALDEIRADGSLSVRTKQATDGRTVSILVYNSGRFFTTDPAAPLQVLVTLLSQRLVHPAVYSSR
jgi:hypothetical protein